MSEISLNSNVSVKTSGNTKLSENTQIRNSNLSNKISDGKFESLSEFERAYDSLIQKHLKRISK